MPGPKLTQVTISLDDEALERAQEVLHELEGAGLRSAALQEGLGTITGAVADSAIAHLERIPGVAAVERSRTITLPDPGSDRQ